MSLCCQAFYWAPVEKKKGLSLKEIQCLSIPSVLLAATLQALDHLDTNEIQ